MENKSKLIATLTDGAITITPVPSEVKKTLTYWYRSLTYDQESRKRIITGEYRTLYTDNFTTAADGTLVNTLTSPIGLASKIITKVKELGYAVSFVDNRTPVPGYDLELGCSLLRDYQKEGVQIALANMGGIIECPTGWGKSYLQAAMIKAFDPEDLKLRNTPLVILTAPEKDLVDKLYADLLEILPDRQIGCIRSGRSRKSDDICVVSLDSLHHIDPTQVGILMIDEVHSAATASRIPKILAMDRAVKWGFSATPTGRFDGADMVTEALVGPSVYVKTYQDGVDVGALVPIVVYWVKTKPPVMGVENLHKYKQRDSQLRHGIIKNTALNETIVQILARVGDKQTLCIMEHLEQMNELVSLNPALSYVHGAKTKQRLKPTRHGNLLPISDKEREKLYNQFKTKEISTILSTSIYRQGVDFPALEIVINLGIVSSSIVTRQVPGRASRNIEGKQESYIVDFWNSWDVDSGDFGKKSKVGAVHSIDIARRKEYTKLGFEQIWVDSIDDLPFLQEPE